MKNTLLKLRWLLALPLLLAGNAQAQTGGQVTFSEHIAPLIYNHCTSCHRTGEVAPFPLTSYAEVVSHAQTIQWVTGTKYMPPWKPDANYKHYLDENTLTDAEIQRISDWVNNGTPQGNPALEPAVPTFPSGSQLGTPDLVIPMQQRFTHQGNGQDMYRIFVLPVNLPADRDIAAIEFRPGNKSIVHHAIIGLDTTQQAQALDAADAGYGYTQFGGFGFEPVETNFGGWVPGSQARFFPAGLGKKLYRRASILLQVHYGPNFITQTDSSVINIFYARQPVTRYVQTLPVISPQTLTNGPFVIPAGQQTTFRTQLLVPFDVSLLSVLPHAHLLGKKWKIWAVKPNGDTIRLVKINDWDFRWQGNYRFTNLLRVPAGSRLQAEATYDNTAQNPRNPFSPPQQVVWGESTTAEMLLSYFDVIPYRAGDESVVLSINPSVVPAPNYTHLSVFPNPSSAAKATASFQLERPGAVTISLYDEMGKLARVMTQARKLPAGSQQVPLDLSGLAAGMYFLRLATPEFSHSEKLVIK
jgi:mono/diheme cytochrome c family protein